MTIKVVVTWDNPGSTLLPDALATVVLAGSGVKKTREAIGVREFELPDGTTSFSVSASFSARFGAVKIVKMENDPARTEPEREEEVWSASQEYGLAAGKLLPKDIPEFGKGHPLVEALSASNVNTAIQIKLRTEFVDVTKFWAAYAEPSQIDEWTKEHARDVNLVVLGRTTGSPMLWFASVPKACEQPSRPGLGCMVFFRPANDGFTRLDATQSMFRLNRYLLKPRKSPIYWKSDVFLYKDPVHKTDPDFVLRASMEDALSKSKKSVVILHPWPNVLDYGDAIATKVPDIAEAAIRFLWSQQFVGKKRAGIKVGRLGLAGFSAGGGALWRALANNLDVVKEVYAFDADGSKGPDVIQWFNRKPANTRCLRMTAASNIAQYRAIKESIERLSGATTRVTAFPPSAASFTTVGATPAWDTVMSSLSPADVAAVRVSKRAWHQFAMFGTSTSAGSFLEGFLVASDF